MLAGTTVAVLSLLTALAMRLARDDGADDEVLALAAGFVVVFVEDFADGFAVDLAAEETADAFAGDFSVGVGFDLGLATALIAGLAGFAGFAAALATFVVLAVDFALFKGLGPASGLPALVFPGAAFTELAFAVLTSVEPLVVAAFPRDLATAGLRMPGLAASAALGSDPARLRWERIRAHS